MIFSSKPVRSFLISQLACFMFTTLVTDGGVIMARYLVGLIFVNLVYFAFGKKNNLLEKKSWVLPIIALVVVFLIPHN